MSGVGVGLVVLSPHLDDAVLSVGSAIAASVAAGRPVEVWTANTCGPDPATVPRRHRAFADYRTRIGEDDAALAVLGAQPRRLGLTERIWRNPRPRTLAGAFRTPGDLSGFGQLGQLQDAVRDAVSRGELWAPLGVGHHVDHVEAALAALTVGLADGVLGRIGFYEDFYALADPARRRHPVTTRRPRPGLPWRADPGAWLMHRLAALPVRGPGLTDYLPELVGLPWACRPLPVGDPAIKVRAVAAYRSQLPKLGGRSRIEALDRRAQGIHGGELLWQAEPA
jgi:LmbE family N-acetylglucosaminyl deacetylase